MRPFGKILLVLALSFGARPAGAQDSGAEPGLPAEGAAPEVPVGARPVLTLNQDRLFKESAFGKAVLARVEDDGRALSLENRRIEDALEKEERDLTERRATMKPADFAIVTSAFDTKVEEIRAAQDGKSRAISRRLEADRQRFFEAATPVLGEILSESGAVAILADSAIIISLTYLDVTPEAISRMDQVLPAKAALVDPGSEGSVAPPPRPEPAPESVPEAAPAPSPDLAPQPTPQPAPQSSP